MLTVALILVLPFLVFSNGVKEALYKTVERYLQRGNYIGALEILHFLGDYKNSQSLYKKVAQFFTPPPAGFFKEEPLIRVKIAQGFKTVTLTCGGVEKNFEPLEGTEFTLKEGCFIRFDRKASIKLPPNTELRIFRYGGQPLAVALLPLETYLKGVLVGEVYLRWPLEVLKAQAVASRTYALFNLYKARKKNLPYDVDATTDYQVFTTFALDHPKVVRAVEETRGEVLTYKGG
ncbi:MAG: hypothetical protein DSZ31_05135, partial [Gammaproteobacteria bacterium]